MYTLPIVRYNFITPNTYKVVKDQKRFTYNFYNSGEFSKYLEDETEHPVDNSRAYDNFEQYLSEHRTKETTGDGQSIQTFTNDASRGLKMAKNTIIYSCVISLPEEISAMGGFGNNKTKKDICEYYFNQMMKHHHFDKNDWCYFAAEHTNTPNTHLHILIYQPASVTGEKLMDYKIKANCMTSKWVQTNTIRHTQAVVNNLNDELIAAFLTIKHDYQKSFRKEISIANYAEQIKELSSEINQFKGDKGKLQYQQLIRYSKLSDDDFNKIKDKEGAMSPSNARFIINKIDALSEFVIGSNNKLLDQKQMINKIENSLSPIDTDNSFINLLNNQSRQKYDDELRTIFGNSILNIVKEKVAVPVLRLSSQHRRHFRNASFKALGCREYESNVSTYIKDCLNETHSFLSKAIANARQSKHKELEQYLQHVRESERLYELEIQRGN